MQDEKADKTSHAQLARTLESLQPSRIEYAAAGGTPPELAFMVDFPRLEFVVEGVIEHRLSTPSGDVRTLRQDSKLALFVPAGAWNEPVWSEPGTVLSLLFGKQRLGFSVLSREDEEFVPRLKHSIDRKGPRTASFILQALGELAWRPEDQATACLLVRALITNSLDLLRHPPQSAPRTTSLFLSIREHIDENHADPLTRESVASAMFISPDYLSHLFRKEAHTSFNDYLVHVRLEHAKHLLKVYDMKIKEVAYRIGFNDSNYFCRLFRQKTGRSPSEYRGHYRSALNAPGPGKQMPDPE